MISPLLNVKWLTYFGPCPQALQQVLPSAAGGHPPVRGALLRALRDQPPRPERHRLAGDHGRPLRHAQVFHRAVRGACGTLLTTPSAAASYGTPTYRSTPTPRPSPSCAAALNPRLCRL